MCQKSKKKILRPSYGKTQNEIRTWKVDWQKTGESSRYKCRLESWSYCTVCTACVRVLCLHGAVYLSVLSPSLPPSLSLSLSLSLLSPILFRLFSEWLENDFRPLRQDKRHSKTNSLRWRKRERERECHVRWTSLWGPLSWSPPPPPPVDSSPCTWLALLRRKWTGTTGLPGFPVLATPRERER